LSYPGKKVWELRSTSQNRLFGNCLSSEVLT